LSIRRNESECVIFRNDYSTINQAQLIDLFVNMRYQRINRITIQFRIHFVKKKEMLNIDDVHSRPTSKYQCLCVLSVFSLMFISFLLHSFAFGQIYLNYIQIQTDKVKGKT